MEYVGRIVAAPEWNWLIVLYFFFGGLAGGLAFISGLAALAGGPGMKPVVRWSALLGLPLVLICLILLVVDLGRPERFWHMLLQSETFYPMFKYWSPISYGSWIVFVFSILAGINFVAALIGNGRTGILGWLNWLPRLIDGGFLGSLFQILLLIFGYLLASYTGSLATASNAPIWSDTPMLGAVFFASGVSTALATLILLMSRDRTQAGHETIARLETADNYAMVLELITLGLFLVLLGSLLWPFLSTRYGIGVVVGTIGLGILIPLLLHLRPRLLGRSTPLLAAVFALIGGYVLRWAIVYVGQEIVIAGR